MTTPEPNPPVRLSNAYAPGLERRSEPRPSLGAAYIAIAASLAVIIGSIGPWATVSVFVAQIEVGGLSGDGRATVWGGVIAGVLMLAVCANPNRLLLALLAALAFLAVSGIGVYDWIKISDATREAENQPLGATVTVGWGLVVMTIGGVIGSICAIVQALQHP